MSEARTFEAISDEDTFNGLEELAKEEADNFFKYNPNSLREVSIDTVDEIGIRVNRRFKFRTEDYSSKGVATVREQLESFHSTPKETLPNKLDCKLVTVMVGLTVKEIARRWGKDVDLFLTSRARINQLAAHPSLIIKVPGNSEAEDTFFVDFHIQEDTNHSGFTARPWNERAKLAHRENYKTPLDLNGLRELDEAYLRAQDLH